LTPRPTFLVATLISCSLALAACGSASSSSSSSAAAAGAARNAPSRAKLVACLKQHGVALPARRGGFRPGGYGGGGGYAAPPAGGGSQGGILPQAGARPRRGGGGFAANPKLRAAITACGGFRGGNFGAARSAPRRASIQRFVTCVGKHGYKLPTPNFSGSGPVFPARIQTNAKFQAASRACQSVLVPTQPGAPSSTPGG
jgi:hypothetical protein